MDQQTFHQHIKNLKVGKSLPDALYLHKSALADTSSELSNLCNKISQVLKIPGLDWDLVKLFKKEFKISLLSYPDFYTCSYPPLKKSVQIDLTKLSTKITSYEESDNPPILHRKELMVLPSDPNYDYFVSLTKEGEEAGLYKNPFKIGFKATWERLIQESGYELNDGHLVKINLPENDITEKHEIDRHLTAIIRYELSAPFKALAKFDFLNGDLSVFDYGCGRGDDLRELEAHGLSVSGWDPNFRPDADLAEANIVNLGFVINVIEDIDERIEAIQRAHSLSTTLTVISAMIAGEATISKFKPYRDGVLTTRNTFQKYYTQSELKFFIERTLDTEAIASGPGVFFVFKDKLAEQRFLLNRTRRTHEWNHLTASRERTGSAELVFVKYRELLEAFWEKCLQLGRLPAGDEFEQLSELETTVGSPKRALKIIDAVADTTDLQSAESERRDDLLVYFALELFSKRTKYNQMPDSLKRDVKAFFGSYQNAQAAARDLLFAIADTALIEEACIAASDTLPSSYLEKEKALTLHKKYLENLPAILRVYVGCAAQLFGNLEDIQLVKVHIHSGKVSFMGYESFESSPLPLLKERVKVKLRNQDVDYFDYVDPFVPPVLYWKGRVIDDSFADHKKQKGFDKKLASIGIVDSDRNFGPRREELDQLLREKNLELRGYRFYKV